MRKRLVALQRVRDDHFSGFAVVLRSPDEIYDYEAATIEFDCTGDKAALFSSLFALGIPAEQIRWHAENRGERMHAFA